MGLCKNQIRAYRKISGIQNILQRAKNEKYKTGKFIRFIFTTAGNPPHDAERLATSGTGVDELRRLGRSDEVNGRQYLPIIRRDPEEANRNRFKQSVQQVVLISMKTCFSYSLPVELAVPNRTAFFYPMAG